MCAYCIYMYIYIYTNIYVEENWFDLLSIACTELQTLFGPYLIRFCASFWTSTGYARCISLLMDTQGASDGQLRSLWKVTKEGAQRARRDGKGQGK